MGKTEIVIGRIDNPLLDRKRNVNSLKAERVRGGSVKVASLLPARKAARISSRMTARSI
jgi:hypothetical protein